MRVAALTLFASTIALAAPDRRSIAEAQLAFLIEHRDFVRNVTDDDDPKRDELPDGGKVAPEQFRFDLGGMYDTAHGYDRGSHKQRDDYYDTYEPDHVEFAVAKDGSAAWLDETVVERYGCRDGLPGEKCDVNRRLHAAMVVSLGARVQPVASHVAVATDAPRTEAPLELPDDALAADAKVVADVFVKSLGAIAKTVSSRSDVVLLGSAFKERYVGGAAVRAQLAKWNLAFKVRDQVAAGLVSKTVGWVAANLDAGKTSYRALFVYERTGGTWQLVQASFSLP